MIKKILKPSGLLSLAYIIDVIQEVIVNKNIPYKFLIADIFWIIEMIFIILFILTLEYLNTGD